MDHCEALLRTRDYDLRATLTGGQAFRWVQEREWWEGVVGRRWVRLQAQAGGILAQTAETSDDWSWLSLYLQTDVDFTSVLGSFPDDEPMRASVVACRGLRLLRQDPWECLGSFIASSAKQIVQIRRIVACLCRQFGEPVTVPPGHGPVHAFPRAERLAQVTEKELRDCGLGFRARHLLGSARTVADCEIDLAGLAHLSLDNARAELVRLPGVGDKIANCVLLFACGFQQAFPVDVWVRRALRELYFPKRQVAPRTLARFIATHFGAYAGYAQQYLFHYMRLRRRRRGSDSPDGSAVWNQRTDTSRPAALQ